MSVSIVVPTHNRFRKLTLLLGSIREHWIDEISDVIVVDDSDKDLPALDFGFNLRLSRHSRRIFISKAKNVGWKSSSSEYVCFIDDDNVITGETIKPLLDMMEKSPSLGAVMPAVYYKSKPDLVWVYATPFLNKRLALNLVGRNLPRDPALEGRVLRTDALPNASLVRRRVLEEVGGFDETLVVNSSLDLAQRIKSHGWKVVSFTGAKVYHDVEVPGKLGWWAVHGSVDPERVRYELRDWFLIMRKLHHGGALVRIAFAIDALRFAAPNLLAYLVRGSDRPRLLKSLLLGYIEGALSYL